DAMHRLETPAFRDHWRDDNLRRQQSTPDAAVAGVWRRVDDDQVRLDARHVQGTIRRHPEVVECRQDEEAFRLCLSGYVPRRPCPLCHCLHRLVGA
ncbi:MAG: hypothetical protein ISS73_05210, partial [Pirellulales bacterium]|nr:hypothetical protein [Pirellulales bacterium]